jgi:hypothetical protein
MIIGIQDIKTFLHCSHCFTIVHTLPFLHFWKCESHLHSFSLFTAEPHLRIQVFWDVMPWWLVNIFRFFWKSEMPPSSGQSGGSVLLQNISKNLLVKMVYLPRTLESSSTLPCEPYSSHCTSYVWDAAWTGLIVAQDDDSSTGSVCSTFSCFMYNNELVSDLQ